MESIVSLQLIASSKELLLTDSYRPEALRLEDKGVDYLLKSISDVMSRMMIGPIMMSVFRVKPC